MTRCEALSLDEKTLMRFLVLFLLSAGILRGSSSDIAVDWLLSSKASKPVLPIYNVFVVVDVVEWFMRCQRRQDSPRIAPASPDILPR